MQETKDQAMFAEAAEAAKSLAQSENFPPTLWIHVDNVAPGQTYIFPPQAGNLWVYYVWIGTPAERIGVFHQASGELEPIHGGENNIAVGEGDFLFYELSSPATDWIRLGYQMT